ncbi:MAG TPA: protein kinase [Polyangiaceae bacterium]|jgi:serine/threonine-protein kinase
MVAPAAASRPFPALAKYEVIEEIGHGGMATVYRARDTRLEREVAVKVIHPHLRESAEVGHRFVVEAQAVAKLRHPNIVEVFDVSSAEDAEKYLVVELVRGATLRKLLKERAPLPPEIAAAIAIDVLAALAHAHDEGVVHRDVKPENVLIEHRTPRGEGETPVPSSGKGEVRTSVKLTDFGIAKLLDAQGVTSTGQVLGSPAHMAPEQIEGGAVDARADVFGAGVLLYEAMVGHLPFQGANPAQVLRRVLDGQYPSAELERPEIGKRLSAILDRALAHDPAGRFDSASAMQNELTAELRRVGVDSPARELEAYFDDPEGYAKDHKKRLIAKLCELAQSAQKEGRALDTAADYNRALAYAPDDPQLLRIVANMQRDAARAQMLRRAGPLALATVAACGFAYFLTQTLKTHAPHPQPLASETARPHPSATTTTSAIATATVTASVTASAPTATATVTIAPIAASKIERTITLSLVPLGGVKLAIDGKDNGTKSTGDMIKLDDHEHTLSFGCEGGVCEPQTKTLPAGKDDTTLSVELHFKDATLTVNDGDSNARFGLEQYPAIVLRPGVPVSVAVPSSRYFVVLFDRNNPARKTNVQLGPGQQQTVDF